MIAITEGPVTLMLTIVIAIPDGPSTLIVPTVSWSMSQRISITLHVYAGGFDFYEVKKKFGF